MIHSQNNEQQIIAKYFKYDIPQFLHILDIGANDGITFSNSYDIISRGATGYLVEASKETFDKLSKVHDNSIGKAHCFNYAITDKNGLMVFYESGTLLSKGDKSLVSTLKAKEMDRWSSANIQFKETAVEAIDFKTFREKAKAPCFDIITIDIEGYEWEVLSQIDLEEVRCKMLIIEFNGVQEKKDTFMQYASLFGMKLHSENPENLIFVK
jgi:FkbM family methyltransferase